jgi:deazaflavin-dependent oxidoreductase (nitroreductase family)
MLGHRFLQLTHRGRRTGLRRRTVLEVLRWEPSSGVVTVMSGFGPTADWLRNLAANGQAHIDIGRDSFTASFRRLSPQEAVEVLADFERHNMVIRPVIRLVLSRLVGWRYDGTPGARARLVAELPLIEFRRLPDGPGGGLARE